MGALKKVSLLRRLKTLFALPSAVIIASRLLREYRPDVVIGVGGLCLRPGDAGGNSLPAFLLWYSNRTWCPVLPTGLLPVL